MISERNYHLYQPPNTCEAGSVPLDVQLIDVRSALEFAEGSMPGAINIALLDNKARAQVGFSYKNLGPQAALDLGYSLVSEKVFSIHQALSGLKKNSPVFVLCARGGFRSRAMCKTLWELGYEAVQIKGGYKAYRNVVIEFLNTVNFSAGLIAIHGQTGVGKTTLLQMLPNALDLEGAASHRGSILGYLGLQPKTQKNFESSLMQQIKSLDMSKPVFIEGESSKIGPLFIPKNILYQLRAAKKLIATADLDLRVERIYDAYIINGTLDQSTIIEALIKLKYLCGEKLINSLIDSVKASKLKTVIKILCTHYYDPKYNHKLQRLEGDFKIDLSNLSTAKALLLNRFHQPSKNYSARLY